MNTNIPILAARVKENPTDSFSKFALALELLKEEKRGQAKMLFESIEAQDPEYVGVYYHLGKLYSEIEENKKALETYKKGIEVSIRLGDLHARSELQGALLNLEIELED